MSQAAQRGALAAISSCLWGRSPGDRRWRPSWARSGASTAALSQAEGSSAELRAGQAGMAGLARRVRTGTALNFPVSGHDAMVEGDDCRCRSCCASRTRSSGSSASSTSPTGPHAVRLIFYSLPQRRCYARHGVDRPAGRHAGLHSRFHVPSVQHGCAAMPVPSATGDQASALAPRARI